MTDAETYASINLNFDSLGWSAGLDPTRHRDPSYFEIADRFLRYANELDFRYTIFVIGRDLENPEVAARVREWSEAGHEIANHSYHHHPNLGSLPREAIEDEVLRSHELIERVTGKEPRGFIAPGWSTSATLLEVLSEHRYLYDTSTFPSYFMWLVLAKLWWNFRKDGRRLRFLERRDKLANLLAPVRPHRVAPGSLIRRSPDGLLVLPLPTTPLLRIPSWHTTAFVFPPWLRDHALSRCLRERYYYHLTHPADLLDGADVERTGWTVRNLERLEVPLDRKEALFASAVGRVDDVGVVRAHGHVSGLAAAHAVPVRLGYGAGGGATGNADGAAVLLRPINPVREVGVRGHVVELTRGLVFQSGP